MHRRTGSAHAHPPARTLGPLPRATMPLGRPASAQAGATAASHIPRFFVAQRAPSLGVAPLLLPSPLQLQAERRRPGAGLLLCRPGRRGGRGCCGRSPQPSDGTPPGAGTPRSRSGLGPRAARVRPAAGGKAGGADRGRPAAACAPRGRAEPAERSGASAPAPGGNKRGWRWGGRPRAGPGAAGAGTPRAASRLSGRGSRRQWAGGRKTRRNLVS